MDSNAPAPTLPNGDDIDLLFEALNMILERRNDDGWLYLQLSIIALPTLLFDNQCTELYIIVKSTFCGKQAHLEHFLRIVVPETRFFPNGVFYKLFMFTANVENLTKDTQVK